MCPNIITWISYTNFKEQFLKLYTYIYIIAQYFAVVFEHYKIDDMAMTLSELNP